MLKINSKVSIIGKEQELNEAINGSKIVDSGIGFDGIEFGWLVLENGDKIFIDKIEVLAIINGRS